MQPKRPWLKEIAIASPCGADWERMPGTDRVRHCPQCDRSVYDLSAMSADEAEVLLAWSEGRICARLFRREDGTVLTADCPVGLRGQVARLRSAARARWAALGVLALGLLGFAAQAEDPPTSLEARPFAEVERRPPPPGVEPARVLTAPPFERVHATPPPFMGIIRRRSASD